MFKTCCCLVRHGPIIIVLFLRDCWRWLIKKRKKTQVQILFHSQTDTTYRFMEALKIAMDNFNWTIAEKDILDPNVALVVLCQCATRMGSDVKRSINVIDWSSEYAVIIIHTGFDNNLPAVPSASKLNIEGKTIKLIDMGLNDYGGFHECKLNQEAKVQLQEYINAFRPGNASDSLPPDTPV